MPFLFDHIVENRVVDLNDSTLQPNNSQGSALFVLQSDSVERARVSIPRLSEMHGMRTYSEEKRMFTFYNVVMQEITKLFRWYC